MKRWGKAKFEQSWRRALRDGIVENSSYPPEQVSPDFDNLALAIAPSAPRSADSLEVAFVRMIIALTAGSRTMFGCRNCPIPLLNSLGAMPLGSPRRSQSTRR